MGSSGGLGRSEVLGIVSVSLAVEPSDPALEPAYSVKEVVEGEVRDVIERLPSSSRTINCESEGLDIVEDSVGADSLETCMEGGFGRSWRMSWSTRRSILYCLVPNIEPWLLCVRVGRGMLPGSSPSSLISCKRELEVEGEAV